MAEPKCRFCQAPLRHSFADLGMSPLSNAFVPVAQHKAFERFFPLHAYVCEACFLVQLEEFETPEGIFSDYLYFSSFSDSWLQHAQKYVEQVTARFGFNGHTQVVEVASNDGYLLQFFQRQGIAVLGIDPAVNVAAVAQSKGIETEVAFFGRQTALSLRERGKGADLMVANNVLAHVPDLNDFVAGFQVLLNPGGVITFEFPSLLRLIAENQFDTIYHEHFSYLSLLVVERVMAAHKLRVFDVESLPTHGGSLRIFACHQDGPHPEAPGVQAQRDKEIQFGLHDLAAYQNFSRKVIDIKGQVLEFFLAARQAGKTVAGYGAPAKGNTLLNYCGVGPEFLSFTVDRSPHKQSTFLPGRRIPVYAPEEIAKRRPDYLFILPWNLRHEIVGQMGMIREWGGKFVVPIPKLEIF